MDLNTNTKISLSVLVFSILICNNFSIHKCNQGHKCVYYRGGQLLNSLNDPGYHLKIPLITNHHNVQITWQTDKLNNVICGSSRGGQAYLDIEVVNKLSSSKECILNVIGEHTVDYDKPLIFDYIPSEVAQFCKNYTLDDIVIREFDKLDEVLLEKLRENVQSYDLSSCLEIKKVRINRPTLDKDMQKKFESIENEQKEKELAQQKKNTEKVILETQLQKEVMEKERQQKTNEIEMMIQISKAKSEAEKQKILDNMEFESKKKKADANKYKVEKQAEGNEMLFSNPNYIRLEAFKATHSNSKLIFGDVPQNALINLGGFTDYTSNKNYNEYNAYSKYMNSYSSKNTSKY